MVISTIECFYRYTSFTTRVEQHVSNIALIPCIVLRLSLASDILAYTQSQTHLYLILFPLKSSSIQAFQAHQPLRTNEKSPHENRIVSIRPQYFVHLTGILKTVSYQGTYSQLRVAETWSFDTVLSISGPGQAPRDFEYTEAAHFLVPGISHGPDLR